jgi:hypothetical protein
MRDIRDDLRDRAHSVGQQIYAEIVRFEGLVSRLKVEQAGRLQHLQAQLRLANKLIEFFAWQDRVRTELATRIATAEAAEQALKGDCGAPTLVGRLSS